MSAAVHNFDIEQGTSLVKQIVWKDSNGSPINLTGYTARMQVRPNVDSEVLLELSTTNGRIVITPLTGTITLNFTPANTVGTYWTKGKYDLEMTSGNGFVTRLIKGTINLSKEITRDD